jgi:hypothetical protein
VLRPKLWVHKQQIAFVTANEIEALLGEDRLVILFTAQGTRNRFDHVREYSAGLRINQSIRRFIE